MAQCSEDPEGGAVGSRPGSLPEDEEEESYEVRDTHLHCYACKDISFIVSVLGVTHQIAKTNNKYIHFC